MRDFIYPRGEIQSPSTVYSLQFIHSFIQSDLQVVHVFLLLGSMGGTQVNMQTPHRKAWEQAPTCCTMRDLNPRPSCCEATVLRTEPPCHTYSITYNIRKQHSTTFNDVQQHAGHLSEYFV